ncbi:hypothetical protein TWF281_006335 [Arthrobotrys megalospora]
MAAMDGAGGSYQTPSEDADSCRHDESATASEYNPSESNFAESTLFDLNTNTSTTTMEKIPGINLHWLYPDNTPFVRRMQAVGLLFIDPPFSDRAVLEEIKKRLRYFRVALRQGKFLLVTYNTWTPAGRIAVEIDVFTTVEESAIANPNGGARASATKIMDLGLEHGVLIIAVPLQSPIGRIKDKIRGVITYIKSVFAFIAMFLTILMAWSIFTQKPPSHANEICRLSSTIYIRAIAAPVLFAMGITVIFWVIQWLDKEIVVWYGIGCEEYGQSVMKGVASVALVWSLALFGACEN